jgi:hypothetical protein
MEHPSTEMQKSAKFSYEFGKILHSIVRKRGRHNEVCGKVRAMQNEHPYPVCPSCSGDAFISIPDVVVELHKATTALGMEAYQRIGTWRKTLVICSQCGRTDTFTKNATEIAARAPGAVTFRAVPPGAR